MNNTATSILIKQPDRVEVGKWFLRCLEENSIVGNFLFSYPHTDNLAESSDDIFGRSDADLEEIFTADFTFSSMFGMILTRDEISFLYSRLNGADCFSEEMVEVRKSDDAITTFEDLLEAAFLDTCAIMYIHFNVSSIRAFYAQKAALIERSLNEFMPEVQEFLKAHLPEGLMEKLEGQEHRSYPLPPQAVVLAASPSFPDFGNQLMSFTRCLANAYLEHMALSDSPTSYVRSWRTEDLLGLPFILPFGFARVFSTPSRLSSEAFGRELAKFTELHFEASKDKSDRPADFDRTYESLIERVNSATEALKTIESLGL